MKRLSFCYVSFSNLILVFFSYCGSQVNEKKTRTREIQNGVVRAVLDQDLFDGSVRGFPWWNQRPQVRDQGEPFCLRTLTKAWPGERWTSPALFYPRPPTREWIPLQICTDNVIDGTGSSFVKTQLMVYIRKMAGSWLDKDDECTSSWDMYTSWGIYNIQQPTARIYK